MRQEQQSGDSDRRHRIRKEFAIASVPARDVQGFRTENSHHSAQKNRRFESFQSSRRGNENSDRKSGWLFNLIRSEFLRRNKNCFLYRRKASLGNEARSAAVIILSDYHWRSPREKHKQRFTDDFYKAALSLLKRSLIDHLFSYS